MDDTVQVAGIDVSKDKLDVHVLASNLDFVVGRDKRGLGDLTRRLRKAGVGEVALEASGDYERIVIETLEADDFVVHLLNPARVRHFAEAAGILAKTDPVAWLQATDRRPVDRPVLPALPWCRSDAKTRTSP
jgi:transposase